MRQSAEMRADETGHGIGAFYEPPQLDVMPAFAVRHGGVGDALKQVCSFLHGAKEDMRIKQADLAGGRAFDVQEEAIELLPHFGTALLADLTQVFAGCGDAGND